MTDVLRVSHLHMGGGCKRKGVAERMWWRTDKELSVTSLQLELISQMQSNVIVDTREPESESTKFCRLTLIAVKSFDSGRIPTPTPIRRTADSQPRVDSAV